MKTQRILYVAVALGTILTGCMNLGTPPEQIGGAYVSPHKYQSYECSHLATELASLSRRENQLITAQNSRVESNRVLAFWYGSGNGDGVEASELANVRGEREAVRTSMEAKGCK
ncbi:MAG: hypothetical protein LBS70_00795 [Candidatus Accumulibacter sp.]|nr:hypothetical protein [Accumulibacter sp.]